jgi:hypothetical protein
MMDYVKASHLLHVFLSATNLLPDNSLWSNNDEIPIPGRPIKPSQIPQNFCHSVLLKTCLLLHRDGCVNDELDPLGSESSLLEELQLQVLVQKNFYFLFFLMVLFWKLRSQSLI